MIGWPVYILTTGKFICIRSGTSRICQTANRYFTALQYNTDRKFPADTLKWNGTCRKSSLFRQNQCVFCNILLPQYGIQ